MGRHNIWYKKRFKLFLSADRITYSPRVKLQTEISEKNENNIRKNPPTIKVGIKYPCRESKSRILSWELEIISEKSNEPVYSWSGYGPPDTFIVKEWNYKDFNNNLVDFREQYIARITLTDKYLGKISKSSEKVLKISAEHSKREEQILLMINEFDLTDPLSRIMEDRLGVVADMFIKDREYQKENESRILVHSKYSFDGHSCHLGNPEHNIELSYNRAKAGQLKIIEFIVHDSVRAARAAKALRTSVSELRNALAQEFRISERNFSEPLGHPGTPEGRTINRRTCFSMSFSAEKLPANKRQLFFITRAESLIKSGDNQRAISYADSALAESPSKEIEAKAYKIKGMANKVIGHLDQAKDFMIKSFRLSPDASTALELADVDIKTNNETEAVKILEPLSETNSEVAYFLGELYLSRGDYKIAHAYYEKAIKISPSLRDAHCKLAACLILLGQEKDSMNRSIEKIIKDCGK